MTHDLAALRRGIDLIAYAALDIELKREGAEWIGLCCFHAERTPSLRFYRDDTGAQRFKCFGCGASGDSIDFVGLRENLEKDKLYDRCAELAGMAPAKRLKPRVVAKYDYVDASGKLVYQVLRMEPGRRGRSKEFAQRRPAADGWTNDMKGVDTILYRLPAVLAAEDVWIVEGEKDVHTLEGLGLVATTNSGGAGAWRRELAESLRGKVVTVCGDQDEPGAKRDAKIARDLQGVAKAVRIASLPANCKDVSDYVAQGGTREGLLAIVGDVREEPEASRIEAAEAMDDWRDRLIVTDTGKPKAVIANVLIVLRQAPEWAGVFAYDEFGRVAHARRETPIGPAGQWGDREDVLLAEWLQHQGILVGQDVAGVAVQTIAREQTFHPVRDYLESLTWDGEHRLTTWLIRHAGAAPTRYVAAISQRWLISAVARVMDPGCKADSMMILEGAQGIRKSSCIERLSSPWFSDEVGDLGSKDAAMQIAGVWIVEMAELDTVSRAEVTRIKTFMSRKRDHYRPPYGRHVVTVPRQCVFGGTVNPDGSGYLKDPTGARRFWPIYCSSRIDLDAIGEERDQLWAEALAKYRHGEVWHLETTELEHEAAVEQRRRFDADPWEQLVITWLGAAPARDQTSVSEILEKCIAKPAGNWTQADKSRVGKIMKSAGWVRFQVRLGSDREWHYRKEM